MIFSQGHPKLTRNKKVGTFSFHIHKQVEVRILNLLWDVMSHLSMKMPHLAPFEGSKGHGAPSDGEYLDVLHNLFGYFREVGAGLCCL